MDYDRKRISKEALQCKVNGRYRTRTGQESVKHRLTGILSTETWMDFSQEVGCQELMLRI